MKRKMLVGFVATISLACGNVGVPNIVTVGPSDITQAQRDAQPLTVSVFAQAVRPTLEPGSMEVVLVAVTSGGGGSNVAEVRWDLGDGTIRTVYDSLDVRHAYPKVGTWTVTATPRTADGRAATSSFQLVLQ